MITLQDLCKQMNISDTTLWRWRKLGWIETFKIGQTVYVSDEEMKRFIARAEAGEFAREVTGAAAQAKERAKGKS